MAVTLGGEKTSATEARTSPRVAPAANRARMKSGALSGAELANKHRPLCPSSEEASSKPMR
eukprot:15427587-Alexandrium_andersonii.AAC.1